MGFTRKSFKMCAFPEIWRAQNLMVARLQNEVCTKGSFRVVKTVPVS